MEKFSGEKTSKFLEAMNKYAEEQRNKLSQEAERIKEAEKIRVEDEILQDAYHLIRREMSEMRIAISSDRAKKEMESRKRLFDKRKEIIKSVFDAARRELSNFVKTEQYIEFLKKSASEMGNLLKTGEVVNGRVKIFTQG